MNLLQPRTKSPTLIRYLLIGKQSPLTSLILAPESLRHNPVISFIQKCPEDLMQLITSLNYFVFGLKSNNVGYDFNVITPESIDEYNRFLADENRITLVFIDTEIEKEHNVFSRINKQDELNYYCFFSNGRTESIGVRNEVINPYQFILALHSNTNAIFSKLQIPPPDIYPSVQVEFKDFVSANHFIPSRNNSCSINRIIGNFYITLESPSTSPTDSDIIETAENRNSWTRQNTYIEQINKLNFFWDFTKEQKLVIYPSPNDSIFSPLLIILPFHNPNIKNTYGEELYRMISTEQTNNYTFSKKTEETGILTAQLLAQRLRYLDDVGSLHASLSLSPVLRLPIKGKSVYKELSSFGTTFFSHLGRAHVRKKLFKTIIKLGEKLKSIYISPELESILIENDRQIVAISDVPVEWIRLQGIPLLFTHDVCRIPETTLHGVMTHYVMNNEFKFMIDKNIISKTLVIFGCDELNFLPWQNIANDMSEEIGFKTALCNTCEEVVEAIKKHNPEFLIFDCHGGYEENTNQTYLWIGEEKLTNDFVVKNEIGAPLIFISACGTAPTYNVTNSIANGFFEVGALSITTTYIPISINGGSHLYIRILRLLKEASEKSIHKNWLNFICHTIRTSVIHQTYNSIRDLFTEEEKINHFNNELAKTLTQSMFFHFRREVFVQMDARISSLSKSEQIYFDSTIPEYLFYSNLGRSDLILFESWIDEFNEANKN